MSADDELSEAILAYLQRGAASWPRADREAAAGVARASDPADLVARVERIVGECLAVPVDWDSLELGDAGRQAAYDVGVRHPQLSQAALDALAWTFTYEWR